MRGFFHWIRRRVHGESLYESSQEEAFDEETTGLIDSSIALLGRMRSRGINLAKPRMVTHLFLGSDHDLSRVAKLLARRGYLIEEQSDGRLLLSEHIAIAEAWIRQVVPEMRQTAGEFDLTYDGWDADVAGEYAEQDT